MTIACPAALRDFLNARVEQDGALCGSLPEAYADADALDAFQDGYKDDAYDGTAGYLKPSQYVICTNDFADPFIIDLDEAAAGYPVAFAYHGQGSWQPNPFPSLPASLPLPTPCAISPLAVTTWHKPLPISNSTAQRKTHTGRKSAPNCAKPQKPPQKKRTNRPVTPTTGNAAASLSPPSVPTPPPCGNGWRTT